MSDLFHECGIAAIYHLDEGEPSPLVPNRDPAQTGRLMPRMLLEIQNRGQLSAGMSSFDPDRNQLVRTFKDLGTVSEVFRLNHQAKFEALIHEYGGPAAIGHVRYATCGKEDRSYAQPFERNHIQKSKWFSFAFNGQLANYQQLREEALADNNFHLSRETDTEILRHLISQELSKNPEIDPLDLLYQLSTRLDGAYNIVYLNAVGDMIVARDPLGIRPLCFAKEGSLFAAASESVALTSLGFQAKSIRSLNPGEAVIIRRGKFDVQQYVGKPQRAHCFFEWIYFANVASTLDDRSVYMVRKRLGEELAALETVEIDDDTIVVPVPDTAKGAAAGMADALNIPWQEGLIRNRYSGRTFIEGNDRAAKARRKYIPLPEVLEGKRVLLVEDSIVRSTTMKALIGQLRDRGRPKEIHIRVACPPITSPCFYGIDMSTISELFAPNFMTGSEITPEIESEMASVIGADSLRYLPLDAIARSIRFDRDSLCQACLDAEYPTPAGRELYQIALGNMHNGEGERTYDT